LPCCAYAAYACDLALKLSAFYTAIAFDNKKEKDKDIKDKELVFTLMLALKATLKELAL
jgi:hypothetical protein